MPVASSPLSQQALAELIERGNGCDRAFVDALLRMDWARSNDTAQRAALSELHAALRAAALRAHTSLRAQIAQGSRRGPTLRRLFDAVPFFERDHFVEEVLGIAYPPLDEVDLTSSEQMTYSPAGYDEIVHAFDLTQLGPGDSFMDLGSGLGKALLLATLLTGAQSTGVDCDGRLCEHGRAAASELCLPEVELRHGDARAVASADVDVVFMYLPFAGEVLATVMQRLLDEAREPRTRSRRRFVCTGPLALARYPELAAVGAAKSWLNVYAWREGARRQKLGRQ